VAAGGVGGLLGACREALHCRDRVVGERGALCLVAGRCASGVQPCDLLPQLGQEGTRLVGALVLVTDGALERLELRVRVGEVAGEHSVLLDALAGQRLDLRADRVELGAQELLLLGLRARLGQRSRHALVVL
jgi:hypothetical protein